MLSKPSYQYSYRLWCDRVISFDMGILRNLTMMFNITVTLCGTEWLCIYMSSSLKDAGHPVQLLPVVVESGAVAGHTSSEWYGIPAHTAVGAALGDFQCSVYPCMTDKGDAGIVWIRCLFLAWHTSYYVFLISVSWSVNDPQSDCCSYVNSATNNSFILYNHPEVSLYLLFILYL